MKIRKTLIRIVIGLLVLVTAVLAVRAVMNGIENGKLTKTLAAMKARGVPLSMKDLAPNCPDADNAAPLWKAIEELLVFDNAEIPLLNKAHDDFQRGNPIPPEKAASIKALVEKNQKALQLFSEAAGKSCFWFGDTDAKSFARKTPKYMQTLRMAKLIGLSAFLQAAEGGLPEALERLRTGLKFAEKLAGESSLINALIVIAQTRVYLHSLGRAAQGKAIKPEILASLIRDLDPKAWRERFAGNIRGERIIFLDMGLEMVRQKPGALSDMFMHSNFWERLFYWLISPIGRRDLRLKLPVFDEIEKLAGRPYFEAREYFKNIPYPSSAKWYRYVSDLAFPSFEAAFLKEAALEAMLLTTRTGLACRIFKSQNGRYPDNLDALVPGILPEIPIDPFTGKPLVFKREGEGFIVYSLGSNQKDDGGKSRFEINVLVSPGNDDWSWKEDK